MMNYMRKLLVYLVSPLCRVLRVDSFPVKRERSCSSHSGFEMALEHRRKGEGDGEEPPLRCPSGAGVGGCSRNWLCCCCGDLARSCRREVCCSFLLLFRREDGTFWSCIIPATEMTKSKTLYPNLRN